MTNCEIKAKETIAEDIKDKALSEKSWKAEYSIKDNTVRVFFPFTAKPTTLKLENTVAYKNAMSFKNLLESTYLPSLYKETGYINPNVRNGVEVVYYITPKLIKDQETKNNLAEKDKSEALAEYEEAQQKQVYEAVFTYRKDYLNDEGDVGFEISKINLNDNSIQISKLTRVEDLDDLQKSIYKQKEKNYVYSTDLTPEVQERLVEQLTGMLMNGISDDLLNKKQPEIFYKETVKIDGKDKEFTFLNVRKSINSRVVELFKKRKDGSITPEEQEEFKYAVIIWNVNVFSKIQQDIINRLKARGYKFKKGKVELLEDDGNLREVYEQVSDIDNQEFEMAEDVTGKSDQLSDYSSLTTSNKEKMSSKLRTFLSSIKSDKSSLITLKIGDKVYDTQYVNENIVIQAINEVTLGLNTYEEMIEALQNAARFIKGREFLSEVVEKLSVERAKGSEIVNQFVDKFNQQKNDLTLITFERKPIVNYSFKKDGKTITVPLKDNKGNAIFYYDYKVINANRNDIKLNLKNDTKQRFIESKELTEETVESSVVKEAFEAYKEFIKYSKENYKDGKFSDPQEAKNKLRDLFATLNFEFSDEFYDELVENKRYKLEINFDTKGTGKSAFNKSYGILHTIFGNLGEDTSIDNIFGSSGANKLFDLEAMFKEYYYNISTLDGKGRNIWGYSMPSPMFRELNDILNLDKPLFQIASDEEQSLYTSSSYILSQLRELSVEDKKLFRENLKYSLFNTLKKKSQEGKELTEMEPAEFIASQIILHIGSDIRTGKNTYWSNKFLTTPSDKSTMYLVQTPNINIPVLEGKPSLSIDSEVVERFYKYFLGEYRRAKAYLDANDSVKSEIDGISTYEPLLFYNFPQLNLKNENNILWKRQGDSWVLRDLDDVVGTLDVESYVKSELLEQLKKEVERVRSKLTDTGLIQNSKFINGFPSSYRKRVPESVSLNKDIRITKDSFGTADKKVITEELIKLHEQSDLNLTEYLVYDYAINYLFHNIEMHTLILGDPAQYLKDEKSKFINKPEVFNSNNIEEIGKYIDSIRDNLSKRMAGVQANRMEGNTMNESSNIVTLVDIETESKIFEEITKFNPDQSEKFKKIKQMDGQEIMTAEEDLKQKLIHGKISQEKYDSLYDKVQKQHEDVEKYGFVTDENKFTDEENLIAQPIKPVVYGNVYQPDLKIFKTTYYKDSAFGLYPEFTQGWELDKIRKALYNLRKNKNIRVDRLVMKSAAKLGAKNSISGVFNPDLTINQDKLEQITENNIDVVPRSRQGIQLEVPYDPYKEEIRIASQQVKLIFNEILNVNWDSQERLINKFLPELKGKNVTGKLLKNYHNNVYKELIENSLSSIYDEIGIDADIDQGIYKFTDLKKLEKTLKDTATKLGYTNLGLEGLSITPDGKEFVLPISFNENGDRLEKLLLSILNKAILQKISGRSFILASEMGFVLDKTWIQELKKAKPESKEITEGVIEGEEAKKVIEQYKSSIVFTDKFDINQGLLPARRSNPNDENSEILPAQVLVSWKFLHNGEKLDINDFVTEDDDGRKFLDTDKVDPEILRVLGIRIPTQGHPSMSSIEIVGFLPGFMGDIIIAPQDFVAMMGSDFDIDKLYGYMYNYQFKKGKLSKLKFDESKIQEIDEEELLLDTELDFTEAFEKAEKAKLNREAYIKKQKKKALQNKLIDIYHTIMLHPVVYDKSLQGITEGRLGELTKELKDTQKAKDYNYYSPSSVTNKIDEYFENKAGKLGVGVFSVNSTFLTVVENLGLSLQKMVIEKDENGKDVAVPTPDYFTIPANSESKESPEKYYIISGNIGVNKLISMFQSASVDNAKLKYLNWISVNKDTMGVAAILSSLANDTILGEDGKPLLNEDYIVYFLSQPVIKEYINAVNSQNVFSDYVDTDELISNLLDNYNKRISKSLDSSSLSQEEKTAYKNQLLHDPSYTLTEIKDFVEKASELNSSDDLFYLISQYQILNKFLKLKEQADVLRQLQYLVNADSKGLPSTLAEANYKSKRTAELISQGHPLIANVERVFLNTTNKEVPEKEILTEMTPESESLFTLQGYLENIADSVSVRIFSKNNNIIASGTEHVAKLSEIITVLSGKRTENYPYKLVNNITKAYLAFLQSSNNMEISDPGKDFKQEILELLQDTETTTSLATDLENFKKTEQYKNSTLLKPFLESLRVKTSEGLKFVDYSASQGLLNTDEQVVQALLELQDLKGVNGTYPLFEKLMKYTFLVKIQKSPITIRQFVPIYLQEAIGLTAKLRKVNSLLNSVNSEKNDELQLAVLSYVADESIPIYTFVEQFFQHNPDELKSVGIDDYTFLDKNNKPTEETSDKILIKGEVRQKYTNIIDGKEFDLPYVSIYNLEEKRPNIYRLIPDSDGIYEKIPNLGKYNLDEFNADALSTATSILPSNKVETMSPVSKPAIKPAVSKEVENPQYEGKPEFNKLPGKSSTPTMTYAGIGSRETPQEVLDQMTEVAKYLDGLGYTLQTGFTFKDKETGIDEEGADKAFSDGSKNKTLFGPSGIRKTIKGVTTQENYDNNVTQKSNAIVKEIHPAPDRLTPGAVKLMARNTNQIFGKNLNNTVDFVLFYAQETKDPLRPKGGTGQAVEMARRKGIPAINMANSNWREELNKVLSQTPSKEVETAETIYSKLGSKTKSKNVVIKSWKELKDATKAITEKGIVSTRISNSNEHFGNPFSSDEEILKKSGYKLIKTSSTKESVEKYINWILTGELPGYLDSRIAIDEEEFRREWIIEKLRSGELKGKPILYYTELKEPSHATALDYLINKYDWSKEVESKVEVKPENISSKGSEFAKKLTNPYNNVRVTYKGKEYKNSEHAYQTWKSGEFNEDVYNEGNKYDKPGVPELRKFAKSRGENTFGIMADILTEKLKQHPELVQGINERGGLAYIEQSTHNVIGDKFWESTGQNKFIEALAQAYRNISQQPTAKPTDEIVTFYNGLTEEQRKQVGTIDDLIKQFNEIPFGYSARDFISEVRERLITSSSSTRILTPVANNTKGKANNVLAQYGVEDTQTDQEKVKTILNKISIDSQTPYFKELANLLKGLDAQFNFTNGLKVNFVENQDSFYNPNDNSINLNVSQKDSQGNTIPAFSERVQFEILHELIHSVLDNRLGLDQAGTIVKNRIARLTKTLESAENLQKAIDLYQLKDDQGNEATVEYLLDKLSKLRATTQDTDSIKYNSEAERSVLNPLINEREFIASVLGDNQTRMWMNEVQYDETGSVLSKIIDAFKTFFNNLIRTFGFSVKDKSALQEAMNIALDLVSYDNNKVPETVEFKEFGNYYRFEVDEKGNIVKGEFSQGSKNNYNPLTKPSKKYQELLNSVAAEKLTKENNVTPTPNVQKTPTASGKVLQGEQVEAFEKASSWLDKPANTEKDNNGNLTEAAILDNMFFLSGPGGSGKTFITEIIVSELNKKGKIALAAAAPTHQAKNVLKENLPKNTEASTVQGLLGMLPDPITKTTFIGNTLEEMKNAYYNGKAPFIFNYDYLVIDEASMINGSQKLVEKVYEGVWSDVNNRYVDQKFYENPDLGTYLKEVLKLKYKLTGRPTKVFLMGDVVQVVPVGVGKFQISKLLTDLLAKEDNNALLNQIRRTNNEEVKKLSLSLRDSFTKLFNDNNAKVNLLEILNSVKPNNNISLLNSKKEVVDNFIRLYKENIASGSPVPNYVNIIWYNNSKHENTVNQTRIIRQLLFNNQEEINVNENLILKSNYTIKDYFGQDKDLFLGTDTKLIVTSVEDGVASFPVGKGRKVRTISNIPVKKLVANVQVGSTILQNVPITIVTPSYFQQIGKKFKDKVILVEGQQLTKQELYSLIENVTNVEYGYVVNSHKIQGSKVINPIVDIENITNSPEDLLHINNMIYTAVSRTVNSLYIYHPRLTPVEGKPISKLTGVNNPQQPVVTESKVTKETTIDYITQRLQLQYSKKAKIYSDTSLTEDERKEKLLEINTLIARLESNLQAIKDNFVLSEYFRMAQKELNDLNQLVKLGENITEEDLYQAIQILGYFDRLYSLLQKEVNNFNDQNNLGDRTYVSPELWDRVKKINKVSEGLKKELINLGLDFTVKVYNQKTRRAIPLQDFQSSEKSAWFRQNILSTHNGKQQLIRSISKVVTDMVRQTNQNIADHEQSDLAAFRKFESKFSFKYLIRIDEFTDPHGLKRKESVFLSRNTINYNNERDRIFKEAESYLDKREKSKFIKRELAKISYDVDARFLFVDEYLKEMREYYKDDTIEWLDANSEQFYLDDILKFHKEQLSEYGDDYAEFRTNAVLDQARKKIRLYLEQKEAFIQSLEEQKLSNEEKKNKLQDWTSYNSPFLLLNEVFGFSKDKGATVNKEWSTIPQEVEVRTFTTASGKVITDRPFVDYKKRTAKNYITNKAKYKFEDGSLTGFYDTNFSAMEQEMIEREARAIKLEDSGDIAGATAEREKLLKWDYLQFAQERQKYYLEMLPYHVKKELKWFNLIDVQKDYKEQFSDALEATLSFNGDSFIAFSFTELLKLIKLSLEFIWDKVTKTLFDKHIQERKQYVDFVTGQIKLNYDPSGFNNTLNKLGLGGVRTNDVFNYFSYLRNAAIQFQERSQAEELIKIGQFLATNLKIEDKTSSKNIHLTDTDIASLNWHINSKLYGAKREELYLGTDHNIKRFITTSNTLALTKAERDKLKLLTQRVAYLKQILPTVTDFRKINQINEQIFLAESQIEGIKKEMTKYTSFGTYTTYVALKRLAFGVTGRLLDFLSSTIMGGIKQGIDGRVYGVESYFKSLSKIMYIYSPNATSSLVTAAGVASLNPTLAATGIGMRLGFGIADITFRREQVAKINQILYRLGALDYLNHREDDNVTSFVNKTHLSEEVLASLKTLNPFSTLSSVEIINKGVPALAVFYETKIKDKNGKEHSLIDAFDVDDDLNLVWKEAEFGTQADAGFSWYKGFNMQQVISKAYAVQTFVNGDYDTTKSRYGDTKLTVRVLMLLRRFMGEFINSRIGTATPEEDTGNIYMGSYIGLGLTLSRVLPKYRTNETVEFKKARIAAAKQISFDLAFLGAMYFVGRLLAKSLEECNNDPECQELSDWEKIEYTGILTIERLLSDNFQLVDPNIIKGKVNTGVISPILGDLMDFYKFAYSSIVLANTEGDTMTHREMIAKNLAPRNIILKKIPIKKWDSQKRKMVDSEKIIYQDPKYKYIVDPITGRPLGKYSKNYEPESRTWYYAKKLFPIIILYLKYQRDEKKAIEMKMKKEEKD